MKKLLLLAAAAATLGTSAIPAAHAGPTDPPLLRKCGFNTTTDVTREAGWQTGVINGGPLLSLVQGTLTCRVVVNNGGLHSSPTVSGTNTSVSAHTNAAGIAIIPPAPLNFPATAADDVSLCASFTPDPGLGATQYWVSENPTVSNSFSTGHWSTNGSDSCGVALSIEPNDPECSIWLALDQRLGTNIAEIWQDCEGYKPII